MKFLPRLNIERNLRSLHGWMGFLIMPWVIIAGLSGLYLNHPSWFAGLLPLAASTPPEEFTLHPTSAPVDAAGAYAAAAAVLGTSQIAKERDDAFRKTEVLTYSTDGASAMVAVESGHVWVQTDYMLRLYDPRLQLIGREVRWSRVISSLHERGWVGNGLGRWLADITAGALVVFGLSGMYLFLAPRIRRNRARKARIAAQVYAGGAEAAPSAEG
jgi:hypothetical protein